MVGGVAEAQQEPGDEEGDAPVSGEGAGVVQQRGHEGGEFADEAVAEHNVHAGGEVFLEVSKQCH